jgi:hypothetical protein
VTNAWHSGWNAAYTDADVDECLNRIDDALGAMDNSHDRH